MNCPGLIPLRCPSSCPHCVKRRGFCRFVGWLSIRFDEPDRAVLVQTPHQLNSPNPGDATMMVGADQAGQPLVACEPFQMNAFVRIMTSEGRGAVAVVRSLGRASGRGRRCGLPAFRREVDGRHADRSVASGPRGPGPWVTKWSLYGSPQQLPRWRFKLTEEPPPSDRSYRHSKQAGALTLVLKARWNPVQAAIRSAVQALADLPRAPTLRTAEILLDQAQGSRSGESWTDSVSKSGSGLSWHWPGSVY